MPASNEKSVSPSELDQHSGRPVYQQIEAVLRREIAMGRYPAGARIPTEEELLKRFSVSRHTIRLAISKLVNEGIVVRYAGRGTFVNDPVQAANRPWGARSLDDILDRTHPGDLEVLKVEMVLALSAPEAAISLQVGPEEQLLRIDSRRRLRGSVLNYSVAHVPERLAFKLPGDLPEALRQNRLLFLVEQANDLTIDMLRQTSSACLATAELAEPLEMDPGPALLKFRNTYFDSADRPVETSVTYCSPERHNLTIELRRERRS